MPVDGHQLEIAIEPQALRELAQHIAAQAARMPQRRYVVGIAGIPASGKSTLAEKLLRALDEVMPGAAVLVPMDGYHLTNQRLTELGLRDRKGAPQTFDAQAYLALLRQARDARQQMVFPIYDRALHEPVLLDRPQQRINASTRVILTEGNYLLLDQPPWNELAQVLDECWWLDTPAERSRDWMLARHQRGGRGAADALRHYERSDAHNTQLVVQCRRPPTRVLRWPAL